LNLLTCNKIHIVGGPGSGKSFLARRLGTILNIPVVYLDDVFWDNNTAGYGVKTEEDKRDKLLNDAIKNHSWIIEGVYYSWLRNAFEKADCIIILTTSCWLRNVRIVKRSLMRKLGLIKSKKETFKDFIDLIKWNNNFDKNNMVGIKESVKEFQEKIIECKSADGFLRLVKAEGRQASLRDFI
jgi:adenylate kinase family enzyme